MDIKNLSTGMYFIKVINSKNKQFTDRFIKE
jgi:hypothetical protein